MEELPPGYRFYPTEEELVSFYLHNKLEGKQVDTRRVIPVIDVYSKEPWDLPKFSGELCNGDREQWFFFTPRQQREAQGGRPNRTTAYGYWKATGSPGYVYSSDNKVIGVKKTMVFYKDKAPTGRKTKWKMNVYRAIEVDNSTNTSASASASTSTPKLRDEFSLCRVYVVSGSARAYDRRPLEPVEAQQKFSNSTEASTSTLKTTMVDKASSSDETYSHSGELGDLPETSAGINSSNWEINEGFEEPLWEWEQLNFL